jgi:protein-tyrosine phosphatase
MIKVLMVCLVNICRSPLAEGILYSKINADEVFVDSAGTAASHVGNLPDKRSISVARQYGINITNQRARKFTVRDFDSFDFIYAMDNNNYKNVLLLARDKKDESKVKLILEETHPHQNLNVPDPYYGESQGFENVYRMLNKACEIIANKFS